MQIRLGALSIVCWFGGSIGLFERAGAHGWNKGVKGHHRNSRFFVLTGYTPLSPSPSCGTTERRKPANSFAEEAREREGKLARECE